MSQSVRQSELFTAQDWTVIYQAFSNINFNASDPPSINRALVQYLQANYAEDFNDWIASSDFVMMLDTLSWLAGILAYKTDVSARENFFDSATARASILRLARMLSYDAKRNRCASGILKVVAIQTNDDVYDSFGNDLANTTIIWNDPNNPDWFDQFVLVMNNALVSTNPFGLPLSSGTYSNVKTQVYRLNGTFGANQGNLPFTQIFSGTTYPFEIYNLDYDATLGFVERAPNFASALNCVYLSDGFGNASINTGFFFGFKQGKLQNTVTSIATPVENQLIDVNVAGINQTDVWVQTVDQNGNDLQDWTQVPVVFSDNITYNSLPSNQRNIFQVITRDNDQISLRFSDGRFANAPSGLIRAWYRTSNGLNYQIRPSDMGNPKITLNYVNRRGATKALTLTFALQTTVSNSMPAETIEQIRRRAPLVYATQNRMVSGEDYNTFPLQSNLATKIKALNRVYSGQSRFIDLNDPTSNYQETTVFGDDGMFYVEDAASYAEIPLADNLTASQLIEGYIEPTLQTTEVINWFRDYFIRIDRAGGIVLPSLTWTKVSATSVSSSGYFNLDSQYLRQGAMILFSNPDGSQSWAGIDSVTGTTTTVPASGAQGPVVLAASIQNGATVVKIIPRYASTLSTSLTTAISTNITQGISFDLWYDYTTLDETAHFTVQNTNYQPTSTQVKVLSLDCLSGAIWRLTSIGIRYVFESAKAIQFYFDGSRSVDPNTGQVQTDRISLLDINMNLATNQSFGKNYDLTIDKMIRYPGGLLDPRRVAVKLTDSNNVGFPDVPDTYWNVISTLASSTYLFWQVQYDGTFAPFYNMRVYDREMDRLSDRSVSVGTVAFQIASDTAPNSFWVKAPTGWTEDYRDYRFGRGRGPNVAQSWVKADTSMDQTIVGTSLRVMWKHYAPADRRIDPSRSNIIDIFVLPAEYDLAVRQWIANGCVSGDEPTTISDFELRQMFASNESFKMFSDDIVWRPVSYRYLFGSVSDAMLRASFNVVKLPNTTLSDGEIQTRVLSAVNAYFGADFWDFGETFFYTELAAYIHIQLAGVIASVVIVPEVSSGSFGDLFEVRCRADEVFISTAQVSDVNMVGNYTAANLRMN